MTDSYTNEPITNNLTATNTITDIEDKKKKKAKDDVFSNITVLNEPNRKIPKIIEEVLAHGISVSLAPNGYYIEGFYGLNADTKHVGFALAQETNEPEYLVLYDNKNHKHLIKSFEDLVKFHNHVWGLFFKISEDYKKPDILWFGFMLQYNVLSITPGNVK
jgi:hypothetical protein